MEEEVQKTHSRAIFENFKQDVQELREFLQEL
jgi:hypothetical protein